MNVGECQASKLPRRWEACLFCRLQPTHVLDQDPNQASAISERFLYRAVATKVELYLTLIMMEGPDGALIRLLYGSRF